MSEQPDTMERLWRVIQSGGYEALRRESLAGASPEAHFYRALAAFSAGDYPNALADVDVAAQAQPGDLLYSAAQEYLGRVVQHGITGVYVDGEAFAAFIRGGGNLALYEATSRALRLTYQSYETLSLLDIGVGDGMALLPALTQNINRLTLIEPSGPMLDRTQAELARLGVSARTHQVTLQAFVAQASTLAAGAEHWTLAQATFSLQSIAPAERPPLIAWLRAHVDRLLIAEFDVPAFGDNLDPARVRYITGRYALGLRDYADDGGVVAGGFLMPVFFGYFDPGVARTNWEGPASEWEDLLHDAGFTQVAQQPLYDYWWAPGILFDAR